MARQLVRWHVPRAPIPYAIDSAETHSTTHTGPVHEVLFSEDILPEIIFQLKCVLQGNKWKRPVSQLLVTNKAFFHAGIGVLWHSMTSLKPALKLLPWFTASRYEGLGVHKYSAADDWRRFNLYAPHIHRYTFEHCSKIEIGAPYVVELLTLPERPDPLFLNLQHVAISPLGFVGVPPTFFLMTPSLRTFERLTTPLKDPLETRDMQPESSSPSEDLMAVIPRMAAASFHLHSFTYLGPTNDEFIARLCQLTTLKSLRLIITSRQSIFALRRIRRLPLIEKISIEMLCPDTSKDQSRTLSEDSSTPPIAEKMPEIRALSVFTTQFGQGQVFCTLLPLRLRQLCLRFF